MWAILRQVRDFVCKGRNAEKQSPFPGKQSQTLFPQETLLPHFTEINGETVGASGVTAQVLHDCLPSKRNFASLGCGVFLIHIFDLLRVLCCLHSVPDNRESKGAKRESKGSNRESKGASLNLLRGRETLLESVMCGVRGRGRQSRWSALSV